MPRLCVNPPAYRERSKLVSHHIETVRTWPLKISVIAPESQCSENSGLSVHPNPVYYFGQVIH